MIENQTVIVVDLGNYKTSAQEPLPFKAILYEITDYPLYWVRSLATGKEYELYDSQILEGLEIESIKLMLNLDLYGR